MKIIKLIQKLFHDLLDWGFPDKLESNDSFQSTYHCKFCDKAITQDSTGAWFHLSRIIKK